MAVYDKDGLMIDNVYNTIGNVLEQAYDIAGTELIDQEEPVEYSIDNVVSYFRQGTLEVASAVNALSSQWQSFIFITDTHGSQNLNHSQAIGLYLLANTKAKMLVLGGDYSANAWVKTEYQNYVAPFLSSEMMKNIYAVMGNHETFNSGRAEALQCIYTDFLEDKTNITGALDQNYYYLDSVGTKTRYMFLNTSDYGTQDMSATQKAWISTNAQLPNSTWNLVVIGHVNIAQLAGVTYQNESDGTGIMNAIKSTNGTLVGYFCGHQHIDYVEKIYGMYHATFLCDKLENTNYYDGISVTDRVSGTTSEQAVTVISINTTTKDVVCRRVGAGRNSTFSFNYGV